jgi:hypothetical protein
MDTTPWKGFTAKKIEPCEASHGEGFDDEFDGGLSCTTTHHQPSCASKVSTKKWGHHKLVGVTWHCQDQKFQTAFKMKEKCVFFGVHWLAASAECISVSLLVIFGCGAAVANGADDASQRLMVSLAFGMSVTASRLWYMRSRTIPAGKLTLPLPSVSCLVAA